MPFDGRTPALTIQPLEAALTQSGIEPIDSRVLDAHKAEELRRHPASWFYQHRVVVQIATLVLLIAVLVGVLCISPSRAPGCGFCRGCNITRRRDRKVGAAGSRPGALAGAKNP